MSKTSYQILVVDDNRDDVWAVKRALEDEGYEVLTADDGLHALANARRYHFDLIILDIVMPGMDGLWVCRQLRQKPALSGVPILLLTGHPGFVDAVKGLDQGADDYLIKSSDTKELRARVRALLRRTQHESQKSVASEDESSALKAGDLSLLPKTREAQVGRTTVKLTPREFDLLHYMMSHSGEVFSSDELLQQVWGYPAGSISTSLVRWHVKSLRKKIEPVPNQPIYLRAIPHHGYILDPEPDH